MNATKEVREKMFALVAKLGGVTRTAHLLGTTVRTIDAIVCGWSLRPSTLERVCARMPEVRIVEVAATTVAAEDRRAS